MIIQFVAGTEFRVLCQGKEILVDPSSNSAAQDFNPDVILLSHYDSDHAPRSDLRSWLKKSKKNITILGPDVESENKEKFLKEFVAEYPQHRLVMQAFDFEESFQSIQICGLTHTVRDQLAFFIKAPEASFMHIANASINRLSYDRRLDPIWHKFKNTCPTFLAIMAGGVSARMNTSEGAPYIRENIHMSAVEGAYLSSEIKPKIAVAMGAFGDSPTKSARKHGFSFSEIEDYYRWSMEHIHPEIEIPTLRPGFCMRLGEEIHQES